MKEVFFYICPGDPDLFRLGSFPPRHRSRSRHPHLLGAAAGPGHALPSDLRPHHLHAHRLHGLPRQHVRAAGLRLRPSAARRRRLPAAQLLRAGLSGGGGGITFGDHVTLTAPHRRPRPSPSTPDRPLLQVLRFTWRRSGNVQLLPGPEGQSFLWVNPGGQRLHRFREGPTLIVDLWDPQIGLFYPSSGCRAAINSGVCLVFIRCLNLDIKTLETLFLF